MAVDWIRITALVPRERYNRLPSCATSTIDGAKRRVRGEIADDARGRIVTADEQAAQIGEEVVARVVGREGPEERIVERPAGNRATLVHAIAVGIGKQRDSMKLGLVVGPSVAGQP